MEVQHKPARRLWNALWAVVALGAAAAYYADFFRLATDRPWSHGIGDWLDPYYVNLVQENWYRTLVGLHGHVTPPMYFPDEAARYSHGFVLYAPIYSALRLFLHPFIANTMTLAVVMIGGSWCLYLVCRRLQLSVIEAFVLSASFWTSPNIVNAGTVVWGQRVTVYLIPPILLVLLAAIGTYERRRRTGLVLGALGGLLSGLLLAQDFYTVALLALLAGLVAATFVLRRPRPASTWIRDRAVAVGSTVRSVPRSSRPGVVWLVVAAISGSAALAIAVWPLERFYIGSWGISARNPGRVWIVGQLALGWYCARWAVLLLAVAIRRAPRSLAPAEATLFGAVRPDRRRLATVIAGGAVAGTLVFLWIYLKPYLEFPTFSREMIVEVLHQPPSTFSNSLRATIRSAHPFESLRPFGVALGLALLMSVFPRAVDRRTRLDALWFILVSALVILITLRFGDWSPWMTLFSWMPGMSAVRDPKRMIYLYELAVVLLATIWLSRMPRRSLVRVAGILLVAGITAGEWHTAVVRYDRDVRLFDRWIRSPIEIEPSCRNFFIKGASDDYMSRSDNMWGLYAIDAGFVALEHSIPTLNGYSVWGPKDWAFMNPHLPGYLTLVDEWIRKHNLHGVCELDIDARTMKPHVIRP